MEDQRDLLRPAEVASRLGISRTKTYELIARGEIPGVMRVGHSIRVSAKRIDAWIESRATPVQPA